ncbi:MAG: hypothetical protein JW814_02795 [Candidatus Krumholzibacteriota bacterium]|nr:hypothetical protein [Candidatus Krumholzibacteriota bacterium]
MFDEFPGKDIIEQAEDLIMKMRDIQSCRIATDDSGRIAEIHVVAATNRPPKMIARDVETCLKAQLGIAVDYRKIGVVLIDVVDDDSESLPELEEIARPVFSPDNIIERRFSEAGSISEEIEDPLPGNESPQLEFLEDDSRAQFRGMSLTINENRIEVEVKLERNGIEVTGSLGALRKSGPVYNTIAGATIIALSELLDEKFDLCLSGIEELELSGNKALVAAVELIEGRTIRSFSGSAFVGRDPNEASVLAILDAVNRPFGRWKSRREIHYRIR